MATKPTWVVLSKTSGSGDDSFNVSASPHTGRIKRSGTITVTGKSASPKTFTIEQSPKAEFISFNDGTKSRDFSISKDGGSLPIPIISNAQGVKFELLNAVGDTASSTEMQCWFEIKQGSGASEMTSIQTTYHSENAQTITIPSPLWAPAGNPTNNNEAISGDPGKISQFNGTITLHFAVNTADVPQYIRYRITTIGTGDYVTGKIEQTAGTAFLKLYDNADHTGKELTNVTLSQEGTACAVYVDSNDTWSVS